MLQSLLPEFAVMLNKIKSDKYCYEELNFIGTEFDDKDLGFLLLALETNTHVKTLYLQNNKITEEGVALIQKHKLLHPTLTNVCLEGNEISAPNISADFTNYHSANTTKPESFFRSFKDFLQNKIDNKSTILDFSNEENIEDLKIYFINKALINPDSNFNEVDLSNCTINDYDIQVLSDGFIKSPKLRNIDLSNNNISELGARKLLYTVEQNPNLLRINLKNNPLIPHNVRDSIKDALNSNLKNFSQSSSDRIDNVNKETSKLDLRGKEVGNQELSELLNLLDTENFASVTTIDLANNHIDDEGAKIVSEIIKKFDRITEINLRNNRITAAGAILIKYALIDEYRDTTVHLGLNKITAKQVLETYEAAAKNNLENLKRKFDQIDSSNNSITNEKAEFEEAAKNNLKRKFDQIDSSNNNITNEKGGFIENELPSTKANGPSYIKFTIPPKKSHNSSLPK